jgi:oligosaccharyltransferase complex subunit beta
VTDIAGNSDVVLRNFLAPSAVVKGPINPIIYSGGFATIDRPNDFRFPIVSGGLEHSMATTDRVVSSYSYAHDIIPIYALQGRTGGRVVFVHSPTFATDLYFGKEVTFDDHLKNLSVPLSNGNRALLLQLSEYVTHYKSEVHIISANHFDATTKVTPVQYHVKQNITVIAKLEFVEEGAWKPFNKEEVQVEVFMLGVFVRRHMKRVGDGQFQETIMLPDRAGNFKIKVFTDKEGWRNAREEMAIAIRPLAIREKEKFLFCAQPYQLSMILVMAAAFVGSVHFLYHKPTQAI